MVNPDNWHSYLHDSIIWLGAGVQISLYPSTHYNVQAGDDRSHRGIGRSEKYFRAKPVLPTNLFYKIYD